jgi:hypothetical protein
MALVAIQSAAGPIAATPANAADVRPIPNDAQTSLVERYLTALRGAKYAAAFALLDDAERAYYRDAQNFASVFTADAYRVSAFRLLDVRGNPALGRVYFARETATFRDHARDVDLSVTATVPLGVVPEHGAWRVKDPGHPWRAWATSASASGNDVRVTVKKLSFFPRRIEAVVSIENSGSDFVTVLAYGKSRLRDDAGRSYPTIATRDWSLTDKVLFEGLHLAPHARYTGLLAFECEPLDKPGRTFSFTLAPLLVDGGDAPFAIDVPQIAPVPATGSR